MTPESRTQFEQWAIRHFIRLVVDNVLERKGDGYRHGNVQYSWIGWQACCSLKEKEVQTLNDMLTSRDEQLRSADAYFVNTALEVVELREQLTALRERV